MLYLLYILYSGLFLSVCHTLGKPLKNYFKAGNDIELTCLGFVALCLIGYFCFWAYYFNHIIGNIVSYSFILYSLFSMGRLFLKKELIRYLSPEFIHLFKVFILAGLFYISCMYLFGNTSDILLSVRHRFFNLPMEDHLIPKIFGARLRDGEPLSPFLGKWLSSDRPPLQAGLYLLFSWDNVKINYQAIAMVIQFSWIFSILLLVKEITKNPRVKTVALLLSIFSGFYLQNTVFTWPKLLASSLCIISLTYFWKWINLSHRRSLLFSGISLGLGLLAHAGIAFTAPCFGILLLFRLWQGVDRKLIVTFILEFIVPILSLLLLWELYKQFSHPPGNRLVKWHLAGVIPIDNRSTLETIIDSYSSLSFSRWWEIRLQNFNMLLGHFSWDLYGLKAGEFFHLLQGLGLILAIPIMGMFKLLKTGSTKEINNKFISLLLIGTALSILFWNVAMFLPNSTGIHQGSYATMTILYVLVAIASYFISGYLLTAIVSLQIFRFFGIWIFPQPNSQLLGNSLNTGHFAFMLIFFVALLYELLKFTPFAFATKKAILSFTKNLKANNSTT